MENKYDTRKMPWLQGALTGGGLDAIPSGFSGPLNPGV